MTVLPVAFGVIVLIGLGLEWWIIARVRTQQGRIRSRVEAVQQSLHERATPSSAQPPSELPAPTFQLSSLRNHQISLDRLLRRGKLVALFFTDTRCGPCEAPLPAIGRAAEFFNRLAPSGTAGTADCTSLAAVSWRVAQAPVSEALNECRAIPRAYAPVSNRVGTPWRR